MQWSRSRRWTALAIFNVLAVCVLGLEKNSGAAPRESNQPFANAVEQRAEMIEQLRELNDLMKEQNELLRSGNLQVVVAQPKPR